MFDPGLITGVASNLVFLGGLKMETDWDRISDFRPGEDPAADEYFYNLTLHLGVVVVGLDNLAGEAGVTCERLFDAALLDIGDIQDFHDVDYDTAVEILSAAVWAYSKDGPFDSAVDRLGCGEY